MKRAQYFFSFALATISFIAARSIQKEGIQNYFEQVAAFNRACQYRYFAVCGYRSRFAAVILF